MVIATAEGKIMLPPARLATTPINHSNPTLRKGGASDAMSLDTNTKSARGALYLHLPKRRQEGMQQARGNAAVTEISGDHDEIIGLTIERGVDYKGSGCLNTHENLVYEEMVGDREGFGSQREKRVSHLTV